MNTDDVLFRCSLDDPLLRVGFHTKGTAAAALFAHESSRPFGWITLVSAIVIMASA